MLPRERLTVSINPLILKRAQDAAFRENRKISNYVEVALMAMLEMSYEDLREAESDANRPRQPS